jgi:DNA-binding IclR family transcriptional regulator
MARSAGSASGEVTRGNRTILHAIRLLGIVARNGGPVALTQVAEAASMSASRAYRYLRSLVDGGLLQQDPDSGRYDLGPGILTLGLAALGRLDPVRQATSILPALTAATGLVSVISVWGSNGPTVIKSEHGLLEAPIRIREGINFPLLTTAAGKIFVAFGEEAQIRPLLARELAELNRGRPEKDRLTPKKIDSLRADLRRRGLAVAIRERASNANLAAPIFDRDGRLQLVLTVTGTAGEFDARLDGMPARTLKAAADRLSRHLGADVGEESGALALA